LFGIEHLVFGTDYPFWREEAHQLAMSYILEAGFSERDLEAIYGRNAEMLFADRLPVLR